MQMNFSTEIVIIITQYFYILYGIFKLKSNLHAPNLHTCIIYIRVNILPVCERKYTRELIYIRVN